MNVETRFAIIGCGNIASRHARQIAEKGKLLAVCDIIPEKADALASQFGAKAYYSLEQLLEKELTTEIVSICTPNGLHAKHSILSLKAGKHVLCEKPMAINSGEAREMMRTATQTGKKLFVVKQNRFNPPVVFVKQLLEDNKLGIITGFQINCFWNRPAAYYQESAWRGTLDMDGGTLFTQFSHFIDLLYWLLGDVDEVRGFRTNFLHGHHIQFEDTGVAILRLKSGALGSLHYTINSYEKNLEGSMTLFGEKGSLKIGGQYLNELEYFNVEGQSKPILMESRNSNSYGYYEGSMSNHDKVYEMLLKSLQDPAIPFITMEETLRTIEIIEQIYQASPLLNK